MDPDEHLVQRTLDGDLGSFEDLVERHRDVVFRVAARIVGHHNADDVAQDSFLKAFHRLSRFRGESSFRTWLLTITHNTALSALARPSAEPQADPTPDDGDTSSTQAGERTPADRLEDSERRDRLTEKLRLLPPAHRAVLVLRDIEGFSYEEIAQVTESPVGSVKGRLFRARGELIEILRSNSYDWQLPR